MTRLQIGAIMVLSFCVLAVNVSRANGARLHQEDDPKAMNSAMVHLKEAQGLVDKALPIYGGRQNRVHYLVKLAVDDLTVALQFRPRDRAMSGQREEAALNEQLRKIPDVKEKPRSSVKAVQAAASDASFNRAGLALSAAKTDLARVKSVSSLSFKNARSLVDLALADIVRAVGPVHGAKPKSKKRAT